MPIDKSMLLMMLMQSAPMLLGALHRDADNINVKHYSEHGFPTTGEWNPMTPTSALETLYPDINNAIERGYDIGLMEDEFNTNPEVLDLSTFNDIFENTNTITHKYANTPLDFPSDFIVNPFAEDPEDSYDPGALNFLFSQLVGGEAKRKPAAASALNMLNLNPNIGIK